MQWAYCDGGKRRDGIRSGQYDCTARSLAIALQIPYWAAFGICERMVPGFSDGKGITPVVWYRVMTSCGFTATAVPPEEGLYIIETLAHVVAAYGDLVLDEWDSSIYVKANYNRFWVRERKQDNGHS